MTYGLPDVTALLALLGRLDLDERQRRIERQKLDALLAIGETATWPAPSAARYFGEHEHKPCAIATIARGPARVWDGMVARQKALSAVVRTGQPLRVAYLVDRCWGRAKRRNARLRHDSSRPVGRRRRARQAAMAFGVSPSSSRKAISRRYRGPWRLASRRHARPRCCAATCRSRSATTPRRAAGAGAAPGAMPAASAAPITRWTRRCGSACARCGSRSRASNRCRLTSSSTTPTLLAMVRDRRSIRQACRDAGVGASKLRRYGDRLPRAIGGS